MKIPSSFLGLAMVLLGLNSSYAAPVQFRVFRPDGKPCAAAQLVIGAYAAQQSWMRRTDASGRLTLNMTPLSDKRLGDVVVYAPGFGLLHADIRAGDNLLRLTNERVVEGVIRNARGKPQSGARIRLREIEEFFGPTGTDTFVYSVPEQLTPSFTTRTQADGRWKISGVPAQKTIVIALDDPAYLYDSVEAPIGIAASVPAPEMTAKPGATIAGRVVDEAGRPLSGIKVFSLFPEGERHSASLRRQSAVTGQDGVYKLTSLATGTYEIQTEAPSKDGVAAALKKVQAREGQTTAASLIRFTAAAMVQGLVTDKASGRPLSQVYISSSGPQGVYGPSTTTDTRGKFQLRLVAGIHHLEIAGPYGYLRQNVKVSLFANQVKPLNLTLDHGHTISGTTANAKGEPMGGVFLFITQSRGESGKSQGGGAPIGVTSDSRGLWTARGLAAGQITISPEATWSILGPFRFKVPTREPLQVRVQRH